MGGNHTKWSIRRRLQDIEQQIILISKNVGQCKTDSDPRISEATRDTYTWVTRFAKTYNEHWIEESRPDPYEHFPTYPYFQDLFEMFD